MMNLGIEEKGFETVNWKQIDGMDERPGRCYPPGLAME
jgi:hypothetical protein